MSDLPSAWAVTTLGAVAKWGSGGTPSRANSAYFDGHIPWIKTGELGPRLVLNSEECISEAAVADSSAKVFPKGSVVLAMYGATIGKTSILGIDAATNQACAVGLPLPGVTTSEYLLHYLSSQREAFVKAGQGGAQPNISQAVVKQWPCPLAPLPEQQRIADKLDTVLARVDACRDRLARVAPLLKRFRQSVLAAAMSGDLTADFGPSESRAWIGGSAVQLKSCCGLDVGYAFKSAEFEDVGVRLLRGDNIEPGRLRWTDAKCFPESKLSDLGHLQLREGEIVLAMDRPIISTGLKLARVTASDLPAVLVQRVCRFKPAAALQQGFLFCLLQSSAFIEHLSSKQNGSSIPHISGGQILSFEIRVPSPEEQTEIVRRVETLFAFADRLQARLAQAQTAVARLTPALLAKAFRGELVPQDPADEPATALLQRLAQARPAATPARKPSRRKAG